METFALICSVVGSVTAGTWLLRSKLSDLETALKVHTIEELHERKELTARVIKLERRRGR